MKHHMMSGGGGIQLHLVETGNASGRPIVFHPWLFAVLARLDSTDEFCIGRYYRLVAMDIRGHGLSEKPREGYSDPRLWAMTCRRS